MGVYVGDNLVAGNVGEVYSKAQVDAMIANAVALAEPTGSIKPFAGTTIPDGYLLCDGSAVSRTTYAALFAVIGTTYGTGDGSTTFNLPDLIERVPRMTSSHSRGVKNAGWAPNITGIVGDSIGTCIAAYVNAENGTSGALTMTKMNIYGVNNTAANTDTQQFRLNFDASRCWDGYNSSASSISAANLTMFWVVKY